MSGTTTKTGIYGILNVATGKWYVGQAADIACRWAKHKRELKAGTHHSQKLQRSYDKHRSGAFLFVILEECSLLDLDERESYWIREKDSLNNGYNMTAGGGGTRGWKMPEETRLRMKRERSGANAYWYGKKQPRETNEKRRLAQLGEKNHNYGKKFSSETIEKLRSANIGREPPNKRPVRCVETGKIYESAKAAAMELGLDHSSLTKCCRGLRRVCGGCHWEVACGES